MTEFRAIVLAAGKGTRMKSDLPKVLVPVAGRPMLEYVLDALSAAGVRQTIVVIGYRGELVKQTLAGRPGITFAEQAQQLGTGHAVMMCREQLASYTGGVFVLAGDSPMVQADTLRTLVEHFERLRPACLLGTAHKADPAGLGRIQRADDGRFLGIVEEKDATDAQRRITEVNMSTYLFNATDLLFALDGIRADNAQREYYLTDCPAVLINAGRDVRAMPVLKPQETLSINTVDELAVVESALQRPTEGASTN